MANISSCLGTMTFDETFVKKHFDAFEMWSDSLCGSLSYGFDYINTMDLLKTNTVSFYGSGRWSWATMLDASWLYGDNGLCQDFFDTLCEEEATIEFEFTDYEGGCELFYDSNYTVHFTKDRNIVSIENYTNYLDVTYDLLVKKELEAGGCVDDYTDDVLREAFLVNPTDVRNYFKADTTANGYLLDWLLEDGDWCKEMKENILLWRDKEKC